MDRKDCKQRNSEVGKIVENERMSKMQKRYDAIDGLRTITCLGIVLMHVRANGNSAI